MEGGARLTTTNLVPVVIVAVLALLAPWLAIRIPRVRVPVAVVEVVLGLLFGRSGLGLLHETPVLRFLSLFGLSYLMFLSGLEIDLRRLFGGRDGAPGDLSVAFAVVGLGLGLGFLVILTLHRQGFFQDPLALAVLLVAGSPTVVLPALKERGYERTRWGQLTLTTTVLADFLSLTGITILVATANGGGARVLLALLLFLPFLLLLRFARPLQRFWLQRPGELVTGQIDVRGALAVITVFIAFAQVLGTVTVLGAFLAGLAVSVVLGDLKDTLQGKLDAIGYGYFVPFFFLLLGAGVRLPSLAHTGALPSLILLLLGSSLVVSFLPSLLLRLRIAWRETLAAGFLLSTRLSATLAGAAILAGAGLLSGDTYTALVLACLVSALVFPPLAAQMAPPPPPADEERFLLVGEEPLIGHLRRSLLARGLAAEAATSVPRPVPPASVLGVFFTTQALRDAALAELMTARPWKRIVVQADPVEAAALEARGLVPFVPGLAPYVLAETLLRAPIGAALLTGANALSALADVPVYNRALWHRTLRELDLPSGCLVVSVTRGREHIIPRGLTRLLPGDVLTVMAVPETLQEVRRLLAQES